MSKRKSLVANFANLSESASGNNQTSESLPKPVRRMPAGVIGATQKTLTELREDRDRLQAELARNDSTLISLDPTIIDPSPFRDRLNDDDDEAFDSFKKTIAEQQQKTPITVRRHPNSPDRYQVVFGHRRLRAAKELGIQILAQLTDYSDTDLVIAQGLENAARQDLSWIERALFANEMREAGIKAKDIKSALGVDDSQISKFRAVTSVLPIALIEQIGRAPSIGRPRWIELIDLIDSKGDLSLIEKTLSADKVSVQNSDQRFLMALSTVKSKNIRTHDKKTVSRTNLESDAFDDVFLKGGVFKLTVPKPDEDLFAKFIAEELPVLEMKFASFKRKDES